MSIHHIHCYPTDSENLHTTVSFYKYLNNHLEYAKQYNDLKEELAAKYPDNRVAYTDAKADFKNKIIRLAKEDQCNE